jgi:bifunctional non-homologous end joining protein LigD
MDLPELMKAEHVTLYYREGSSDKVYQADIQSQGEGFVVTFAYGRRGSTLSTGTKTNRPVDYETAWQIYSKLVNEKKAKGYTEGPDGTPYQHTDKQQQVSGLIPQLLNPIDEIEASRYVADPNFVMQEKLDGKRTLLRKLGNKIEGINRKGLIISLPQPIVESAQLIPGSFILDGECIGDVLHVFDLLALNSEDYRPHPYRKRYATLLNLLFVAMQKHIQFVPGYSNALDKASWIHQFKEQKAEGVVFKHLLAPYVPGKPNSGGLQLKYKFYVTGSFIVAGINAQRSIALRLHESPSSCGNVTVPPNQPIPKVGSVIEARYLYAFKESGCLFQPVYLGERDDLEPSDCTTQQIKYKAEEDES